MRLIVTLALAILFCISPVLVPLCASGESPPDAGKKTAPQMPFIKEAGELYAGRFPLKKVGSQYVSVRYKDKHGQPIENPLDAINIPETEITAGVFNYEFIDERGEKDYIPKAGVLINDSIYYVESSDKKAWGSFSPSGNPNFGIYKNYFTIDVCAFGASACNNMMFLFRYAKDSVEILDVIRTPDNICANFFSEAAPKLGANKKKRATWWTHIADFDNDGNPEIILWMNCGFVRFEKTFKLFLEIKDERLQVDFNPELYKPLFEEIERENKMKTDKPDAYYVYGFLSGKLSLKRITTMLAGKEDLGEKEHYIIRILNRRDTWDAGFHNLYGDKPVLIRHNLKNETGGK